MVIGNVARPVGIHGEIKVTSPSGEPERLLGLKSIIVNLNNNFRSLEVTRSVITSKWIRIKCDGVDSPEEAALLTGGDIVIAAADRPQQADDQFYVDDLIGCIVSADDGEELGLMREIWHQGHHDIWVVDGPHGEILVPAVKEFILSVDLQDHRITVQRVEGLWED